MDDEGKDRRADTGSGVTRDATTLGPSLTPILVSAVGEPHPDPDLAARGLPDFTALLAAELAASQSRSELPPSSLGVGELILAARELTGWSQRTLAGRAGTSQNAVTAIETGNRLPTVRSLMRLVEAAGLELVVGLRRRGAVQPLLLGALTADADDGLADFLPMTALSPFEGPAAP